MRLTTHESIMGRNRKHDIAYGMGSIWLKKIGKYKYELIEDVIDKLGQYEDIEYEHNIESFNDLDKRLKALEIISIKEVNVCHLMNCDSAKEYNFALSVGRELDDYEFVLLREVLQEPK